MFVKTLYMAFLLTFTAAIRVPPSNTPFNAHHNSQHHQSQQGYIRMYHSNLPHSSHTYQAQSAPVFSSSHGASRPYSSISIGHHVHHAAQNVHTTPVVHGAQHVHAAPIFEGVQNVHAAPGFHGIQYVHAAPIVHGGRQVHAAPVLNGGQHVYVAPAAHGGQHVHAAHDFHGVQQVHAAPVVHGGQYVHTAPAASAFHSANAAPAFHSASHFSNSAATPAKQYSSPMISHIAPHLSKAHYEEEYAHPKYDFAYGVEDHHTGDIHFHKETRDGDTTKGEYSLHEADGLIRTVKYTVDKHSGFNAVVERSGQRNHQQAAAHHQVPPHHQAPHHHH